MLAATIGAAPTYAQGRGGVHNPHVASTTPTTTSSTTSKPSTTTTAPTTTTTHVNPIATKISTHPQLASKCTALLPKDMTLNQAASGFRNQGQFIAALHVSKNLNIPFAQLKATMLGTPTSKTSTASAPMSLGQAIHKLRPTVDADDAAEHATSQATTDVKTTTGTSSRSTTSTSTHQ